MCPPPLFAPPSPSPDPTFDPYDPLASRRLAESAASLKAKLVECIAFKARVPEMKVCGPAQQGRCTFPFSAPPWC